MHEKLEALLADEAYSELIKKLESKPSLDSQEQFFIGISYYKTSQFESAEKTFEELIKSTPTNEIKTYLIITKLKLEKLMEAMTLFKSLCEKENENIIKFIEQNDYKNALNLTLFLKSIPLELTKKESKSDDLIELAKTYNYSELTLALAKIIKN